MDYRPKSIASIVLATVLVCSFIPGLHHLGPFVLHSTAASIERTARIVDHVSGYAPHPHHDDDRDD